MSALEKKLRRKLRNKARQAGLTIEGVIRTSASQLQDVQRVDLALVIDDMRAQAERDMKLRCALGELARNGDAQAAKKKRQLNDWKLGRNVTVTGEYMNESGKRFARGNCDAARINKALTLKGVSK